MGMFSGAADEYLSSATPKTGGMFSGAADEYLASSLPAALPGMAPGRAERLADLQSRGGDYALNQVAPSQKPAGFIERNILAPMETGIRTGQLATEMATGASAQDLAASNRAIEMAGRPMQAQAQKFQGDGFVDNIKKDPLGAAQHYLIQSPVQSLAAMGTAALPLAVPAVAAGPAGISAASGAVSGALEYSGQVMSLLQERGVDVGNPKALDAAFNDPMIMGDVRKSAAARAIPIAAVDALSAGGASALFKKPIQQIGKQTVKAALGGLALESASGMAGEAAGQLAQGAVEGDITKRIDSSSIVAEGFGELGPGAVTVGGVGARKMVGNRPIVAPGLRDALPSQPPPIGAPGSQVVGEPEQIAPPPLPKTPEQQNQELGQKLIDAISQVFGIAKPDTTPVEITDAPPVSPEIPAMAKSRIRPLVNQGIKQLDAQNQAVRDVERQAELSTPPMAQNLDVPSNEAWDQGNPQAPDLGTLDDVPSGENFPSSPHSTAGRQPFAPKIIGAKRKSKRILKTFKDVINQRVREGGKINIPKSKLGELEYLFDGDSGKRLKNRWFKVFDDTVGGPNQGDFGGPAMKPKSGLKDLGETLESMGATDIRDAEGNLDEDQVAKWLNETDIWSRETLDWELAKPERDAVEVEYEKLSNSVVPFEDYDSIMNDRRGGERDEFATINDEDRPLSDGDVVKIHGREFMAEVKDDRNDILLKSKDGHQISVGYGQEIRVDENPYGPSAESLAEGYTGPDPDATDMPKGYQPKSKLGQSIKSGQPQVTRPPRAEGDLPSSEMGKVAIPDPASPTPAPTGTVAGPVAAGPVAPKPVEAKAKPATIDEIRARGKKRAAELAAMETENAAEETAPVIQESRTTEPAKPPPIPPKELDAEPIEPDQPKAKPIGTNAGLDAEAMKRVPGTEKWTAAERITNEQQVAEARRRGLDDPSKLNALVDKAAARIEAGEPDGLDAADVAGIIRFGLAQNKIDREALVERGLTATGAEAVEIAKKIEELDASFFKMKDVHNPEGTETARKLQIRNMDRFDPGHAPSVEYEIVRASGDKKLTPNERKQIAAKAKRMATDYKAAQQEADQAARQAERAESISEGVSGINQLTQDNAKGVPIEPVTDMSVKDIESAITDLLKAGCKL